MEENKGKKMYIQMMRETWNREERGRKEKGPR